MVVSNCRNLLQSQSLCEASHERMRPAFPGNRSLVAIPFCCCVVAKLPKSHRQVSGENFGNRFSEGVYLHSDDKIPAVHMFENGCEHLLLGTGELYHEMNKDGNVSKEEFVHRYTLNRSRSMEADTDKSGN